MEASSSSGRSKSIKPARRAADKSIGLGREKIDWPDLRTMD